MSHSSIHLRVSKSTFLLWFSQDTHFLVVFTVVIWSGHLKPVALPFFLTGTWSARGGISLAEWARVGHAILSGHGWWWSVDGNGCFADGESHGTARVLHSPHLMAVCLPPTFLTVMVLLVVVFVCVYSLVSLCFRVCLCNT
jgi:hypothetical protein